MKKTNKPIEFTKKDYDFMQSLSSAILEETPSKISKVIKIWLITIFLFIIWATSAEIDEIQKENGNVIHYGQHQIIQPVNSRISTTIRTLMIGLALKNMWKIKTR